MKTLIVKDFIADCKIYIDPNSAESSLYQMNAYNIEGFSDI